MGRALSDPMMRDGLQVRLGLPLVRCVGAEAGQPGPFGPRLMDTLGVGFRIDPNYGAKCCLHEPAKYALVRGLNGVPERAAGSAGLRPDVWCLADGVSLFFDVSFVEGVSYQNTSTAQVVESRGLCFASERVESKLAKYKTAMEEEGATMLPVVSTSCGVLAKETIRGLRVACGAECPEGCMCSGTAHGLPDQVARYRNLVTSLSFAWVRGVVDVQGCAMYSLASATTSPAIRSRSRRAWRKQQRRMRVVEWRRRCGLLGSRQATLPSIGGL